MRWPLRLQILVPFCGLTVILLIVISVVNAIVASRMVEERIENELADMVGELQDASFPWTLPVLKQMSALTGAQFIAADSSNQVLESTIPITKSLDLPTQANASFLAERVQIDEQNFFHCAVKRRVPEVSQNSPWLHVLYPELALREARRRVVMPPLILGVGALGVVVLMSLIVAGRVTRPIRALRRHVQRIASGDFQTSPLPDRNDELRDLTASVNEMANQLDVAAQAVQRADRLALLGRLSGGLAHQLRNSVTGARMAMQLHRRHCREDHESLEVALRQLTITEDQLQQFLTVGQPQPLERKAANLYDTIAEVIELVGPACVHRRVTLEFQPGQTPLILCADHTRLRQLLLNLVLNGMEAAGPDGWVRIEVDESESESIRIRICDSGSGPPAEVADRLFEPFTTAKPEGVGLGLAVAERIAELHGGRIEYQRDKCTIMAVTLPKRNTSASRNDS
jgi:signal transduction histidine kinase